MGLYCTPHIVNGVENTGRERGSKLLALSRESHVCNQTVIQR